MFLVTFSVTLKRDHWSFYALGVLDLRSDGFIRPSRNHSSSGELNGQDEPGYRRLGVSLSWFVQQTLLVLALLSSFWQEI